MIYIIIFKLQSVLYVSVWDSVLMIQKMGTLQPKMKKVRGVIDAAKKNGANLVFLDEDSVRDHILGFKCIELINLKGEDPMYEALMDAETPQEKMVELGLLNGRIVISIECCILHADCT